MGFFLSIKIFSVYLSPSSRLEGLYSISCTASRALMSHKNNIAIDPKLSYWFVTGNRSAWT